MNANIEQLRTNDPEYYQLLMDDRTPAGYKSGLTKRLARLIQRDGETIQENLNLILA